jgi:Flp pilus assembly protein TadG
MFRTKFDRYRRGAAVVELAVSLPIIMVVLFGILEISNSVALRKSLVVAAYEGSLVAILPGATASDVQSVVTQVVSDRGVNIAQINVTPSDLVAAPKGSLITIDVVAEYDDNCLVFSGLFNSVPLHGTATFVKEF